MATGIVPRIPGTGYVACNAEKILNDVGITMSDGARHLGWKVPVFWRITQGQRSPTEPTVRAVAAMLSRVTGRNVDPGEIWPALAPKGDGQ